MAGKWPELRKMLRPVPADGLPALDKVFAAAVLVINPLLLLVSVVFIGTHVTTGVSVSRLAPDLASCLGYVGALVAARRRWAEPRSILVFTAMWLAMFLCYAGLSGIARMHGLIAYAGIVPLLFAAFIPWEPRYSLVLVVPSMVAVAIAQLLGRPLPVSPSIMVPIGAGAGLAAAASNQFMRRLLFALERAKKRLAASDRMTTLGRLTASMAHELKSPVGASMTEAEMLRRLTGELTQSIGHPEVSDADMREIVSEMTESVSTLSGALDRAGRYIGAMREHTVGEHARPNRQVHIAERVASIETLLAPLCRRANVQMSTQDVDPDITVWGDPGKLDQILLNLAQNAVEAMQGTGGGTLRVSTTAGEDEVLVAVEDDGPGVPEALADRIFEPLFTTRLDGGGTGLGLAICRELAESSFGGTLSLAPADRGARFELRLSRQPHPAIESAQPWQPPQVVAAPAG